MKREDKLMYWGVGVILLIILVQTYFTAEVTVEGVPLPRHEAGMWGIIAWFVILALAIAGAFILHWVVRFFEWVFRRR